jgi:hypothetical protein
MTDDRIELAQKLADVAAGTFDPATKALLQEAVDAVRQDRMKLSRPDIEAIEERRAAAKTEIDDASYYGREYSNFSVATLPIYDIPSLLTYIEDLERVNEYYRTQLGGLDG